MAVNFDVNRLLILSPLLLKAGILRAITLSSRGISMQSGRRGDLINKINVGCKDEIATAFYEWPRNDRKKLPNLNQSLTFGF
jgi:hypothetical protein